MARLRLNTRFFAIVMSVLVVGAVAVFAAQRFGRAKVDPAVLEKEGDEAMASADYLKARDRYALAIDRRPTDLNLRVKLGDAFVKLTSQDTTNLRKAHGTWLEALNIDPSYKPALERLLASLWEAVELQGASTEPETYAEIRRRATQLAKIDPGNIDAQVWPHEATVRQVLSGQAVTDDLLAAAVEGLQAVAQKDPSNATAPSYLAALKIKQALDSFTAQAPREGRRYAQEARAIIDQSLSGQETNAAMQLRAATMLSRLSRVEPGVFDEPTAKRAGECVMAALKHSKPGEKDYDAVNMTAVEFLRNTGKADEASNVAKAFYDQNPKNQRARLTWAKLLSAKADTRNDAIKILSEEIPLPPDAVGIGVVTHKLLQAETVMELVRMRLITAASDKDAAAREKTLAQVSDDLDRLRKLRGDRDYDVLDLQGQLALLQNKPVEAVQLMESANNLVPAQQRNPEMLLRMAGIYTRFVGQPGRARQLCEEVVNSGRSSPAALARGRAMLIELLLQENRVAEADRQYNELKREQPNYPDLSRLNQQLLLVRSGGDPKVAAQVLAKLPEGDNAQRKVKIQFAAAAKDNDEQMRLLADVLRTEPGDANAAAQLAALYRSNSQDDRARQTLQAALKVSPEHSLLKLLLAELDNNSAAQLRDIAEQDLRRTVTDPGELAFKLYELKRGTPSTVAAAYEHLKEAFAAKPDDVRVLGAMLNEQLARSEFDAARPVVERLSKLNADQVGGRLFQHALALAEQRFSDAERIGLDLVKNYDQLAQSWLALGKAQVAVGKWNEAIRSFTEVLGRQPTHYEAMRALVDTYYIAGRTEDAEQRLRDMRQLFPSDQVVRELYLNHLANFGKPEQALADRQSAVEKNPDNPWPYLALAATHFKNAQRLAADQKSQEAKADIEKAFAALATGREKFPEEPRFYSQVAELHQYNGDLKQAESVLNAFAQTERARPQPRPDAWLALAEFYGRAKQPEKVVEAMQEALVRSNNDMDIRLRLVTAQVRAGRVSEAMTTLDAVRNSKDPRIVRSRVELLIAQGRQQEAEAVVRQQLADTQTPDLYNLLGSLLIDLDRLPEAQDALAKSLAKEPTNELARFLQAVVLVKKRPPEIEPAINRLVELKQSKQQSTQARLLLAELYNNSGRRGMAIQELDDALKSMPAVADFRLKLVELYRSERPPNYKAAMDLIAAAEADPVMKNDPVWPREAARVLAQQRSYQAAVMKMTEAIAKSQDSIDYRREMVDLLLQLNDHAGALLQTDRILKDGVDGWWLRLQRGVALGRQVSPEMLKRSAADPAVAKEVSDFRGQSIAEFDQALALADQAKNVEATIEILRQMGKTVGNGEAIRRVGPRLANDPNNDWALLSVALKQVEGDFAGAGADVERLLADPANGRDRPQRRVPLLRAAASAFLSQPQPDAAKVRKYYSELLEFVPDDLAALNNLACLLMDGVDPPDYQAAKNFSERAYNLTRTSQNPNLLLYDTYGWALVLSGGRDHSAGLQVLKTVVEQAPMLVDARYHLGEAYLRSEPPAATLAQKQLDEALRLMNEEEKLGNPPNAKLRKQVETSLAKAREYAKN